MWKIITYSYYLKSFYWAPPYTHIRKKKKSRVRPRYIINIFHVSAVYLIVHVQLWYCRYKPISVGYTRKKKLSTAQFLRAFSAFGRIFQYLLIVAAHGFRWNIRNSAVTIIVGKYYSRLPNSTPIHQPPTAPRTTAGSITKNALKKKNKISSIIILPAQGPCV